MFVFIGSCYFTDASKNENHGTTIKTSITDDCTIEFQQSNAQGPKLFRYSTDRRLGNLFLHAQKDDNTVTPAVSPATSSKNGNSPKTPLQMSSPSNRMRGQNKKQNLCGKCNLKYGSNMDNEYGSVWINVGQL